MRFLLDALVDESALEYVDLAFDRHALLEQVSPWRYYDSRDGFGHALVAVHAWIRRYRAAYDRHYRAVARASRAALHDLEPAETAANALRQLNTIAAIGDAAGLAALCEFDLACERLRAIPATPDNEAARTADVTLGAPYPAIDRARDAAGSINAALDVQRSRVAQGTIRLILDREDVPALDQLLQVLTASGIDRLERVLDPRLARHVENLLTA